jgi:hypothetical protein
MPISIFFQGSFATPRPAPRLPRFRVSSRHEHEQTATSVEQESALHKLTLERRKAEIEKKGREKEEEESEEKNPRERISEKINPSRSFLPTPTSSGNACVIFFTCAPEAKEGRVVSYLTHTELGEKSQKAKSNANTHSTKTNEPETHSHFFVFSFSFCPSCFTCAPDSSPASAVASTVPPT